LDGFTAEISTAQEYVSDVTTPPTVPSGDGIARFFFFFFLEPAFGSRILDIARPRGRLRITWPERAGYLASAEMR